MSKEQNCESEIASIGLTSIKKSKTCDVCQENSKINSNKDPVLAREIQISPWTLIEMDLFTLDDYTFLLVANVTSRFPIVRILSNETSRSVINALKGILTSVCPKGS